ncbi:right-handed parallel beta-helix repeat-containing protein [Methanobrevibacter sp.]|uniref:right-handed parallel beta-helix repeat-containing protein n=1 Tax=Methanobrevibacter sp. TaxID=66852 RepID=UPI0025D29C5C|nr:right-handed parallel beta-helix repeat-containing protein [Methanobrevibacter sp.]
MIIVISLCLISSVSAVDLNENSNNITKEKLSIANESKLAGVFDVEVPDVPDLIANETVYINSQNIDDYFVDGVLPVYHSNKTFIITEDFENLGKLNINASNVVISGTGYTLRNTVFELDANNITLKDLTMDLDSEFDNNDGAGVLVYSDNANLINLDINYIVPTNVEAYGILAEGTSNKPIRNLRLINSKVNFEGHNNDVNVYNCAVKLSNSNNALIENNTISSALPLKDIIFGPNGAELASDLVLTVGIENSHNLSFIGNTLFSEVNKRPDTKYPSLDCMLISKSDYGLIANNSIFMSDFLTYPGVDNYLYGLDIYDLNNLTVIGNNITIITTGGKLAAGTAYPIQITGPISDVNVTKNDLYSFSNGPNIGIYSQNFYGSTSLSITENVINVTGLAGAHEWALVAGIESQDSNSVIYNNTIEVHSVGAVTVDDNLFGISYRQSTSGDHKYDIQNNTIFSDGYYSVNLLSSVDSKIFNNLLVSYNPNVDPTKSGYKYGDISQHRNMEFFNNRVMKAFDYFASLQNNVDNGNIFNYNPENEKDLSNKVDGSKISGEKNNNPYSFNPLIPGTSDKYGGEDGDDQWWNPVNGNSNGNGDNSKGSGDGKGSSSGNSSNSRYTSLKDVLLNYINSNTEDGEVNTTSYNGQATRYEYTNESDVTPSSEGEEGLASQSKSARSLDSPQAGDSASVSKKVYEIDEKNEIDKFIPSVFFIIPIMILLFIGIRRKKSNLN